MTAAGDAPGGPDALRTLIEAPLSRTLGGAVRIAGITRISEPERRNQLLRCHLASAPAGAPASVIVKRRRPGDYDPEAYESFATRGLYREWAGLELLRDVAHETGVELGVPHFYGADRAAGFVVMEDLGSPASLADLLMRGSAHEAERALLLLAAALGRLHAATTGREEDYYRLRDALGPGDGREQREQSAKAGREAFATLVSQSEQLGVRLPAGLDEARDTIVGAIAEPGPFLAYTHGDACPDNNAVVEAPDGPRLRLLDLEFGGYRHALLDGVYGRIRFPTCWCVRDIPEPS